MWLSETQPVLAYQFFPDSAAASKKFGIPIVEVANLTWQTAQLTNKRIGGLAATRCFNGGTRVKGRIQVLEQISAKI
jgi:hypothetical protein